MGLVEILLIIILILTLGSVALLVLLITSKSRASSDTVTRADLDAQKRELQNEIRTAKTETVSLVQGSVNQMGQAQALALRQTLEMQDKRLDESMLALRRTVADNQKLISDAQDKLYQMQDKRLEDMGKSQIEHLSLLNKTLSESLDRLEKQFSELREQNSKALESVRGTVDTQLKQLQKDNSEQLDKMRATVDEKLQKTLDERISQSFKLVNERLQEVYTGLGEMKTLAGNVGDLKKVLSNVKTRGIMGELALGAIMQEMLTPDQYDENVVTKPSTQNRVEFAIKLPGDGTDGSAVYLPVDSKFPADTYHNLIDAYDTGDPEQIKVAYAALEQRMKGCAKDIRDKYIDPPYTTNFGILFVPFEGLYSEVVRHGLADELQRKYQISVAGPTTFSALLNSLRMGFKTLAIQKRSGEVWQVLGAVKTEFEAFGKVLKKAQERIEQTSKELDTLVGVRTRQIKSKLRSVSELPATEAKILIDSAAEEE